MSLCFPWVNWSFVVRRVLKGSAAVEIPWLKPRDRNSLSVSDGRYIPFRLLVMSLGLLGRQCCRSASQQNVGKPYHACTHAKHHSLQSLLARQFNTTSVLFARGERKIPTPTKKQLAAKARKKALKVRKHIYDSEKMPFQDAVAVLKVRIWYFRMLRVHCLCAWRRSK